MTRQPTLFSDFLEVLKVPHTTVYSDKRYHSMAFHSLFGLSKLLKEYGIGSEGFRLDDKSEIAKIEQPFLAHTNSGFVIVTGIENGQVDYISEGAKESVCLSDFEKAWTGNVFLAYPQAASREPDYALHAREEFFIKSKKWVLPACLVLLFAYIFVANHIYAHVSTILLSAINIGGIYLTYLLVQKSLKIKNKSADAVCGILQSGGCDSILELKASKFFGIFGWSEVGFSYFSVSLFTLLVFPQWTNYLALCNACCLPFTVWSIWYQKFRAKSWCTLCVCVQCSLWLLFFCYLGGQWFKDLFPLKIEFFVLGISYLTVMLGINALMPLLQRDDNQDNI